jgi:acetylglutamate kinase
VEGRRVTDAAALQAVILAVAGEVNTQLVASLCARRVKAVGLTGVDAGLVLASRRPPRAITNPLTGETRTVDFGHVGDIRSVDPLPLRTLMAAGMVPVVACLASDGRGNIFNVNADTIAAALAGALEAETLILASDVEGILTEQGVRIPAANACAVRDLIGQGVITGGMAIKAEAGLAALRQGVRRVLIVNGRNPACLWPSAPEDRREGTELRA